MELELESISCVPPGFRFHPTEEELVGYYLKRKVESQQIDLDVIGDLDLYRMEPWDIEGRCKLGYEEQNEWFFFSYKDRKYPTGTRTNRATSAGFWKATGRDKAVLSKERIIGMRKTLVFYNGRAPNGRKSDWIMHEYRLQSSQYAPHQEEGWVVCKAFRKPNTIQKQRFEAWNHNILQTNKYSNPLPLVSTSQSQPHHLFNNSHHQIPFCDPQQQLSTNHLLVREEDQSDINSPSVSRSVPIDQNHEYYGNEFDFNHYDNDWKNIEKLLDSELDKDNPNSFQYSTVHSSTSNNELDSHGHLFGCFSDSKS